MFCKGKSLNVLKEKIEKPLQHKAIVSPFGPFALSGHNNFVILFDDYSLLSGGLLKASSFVPSLFSVKPFNDKGVVNFMGHTQQPTAFVNYWQPFSVPLSFKKAQFSKYCKMRYIFQHLFYAIIGNASQWHFPLKKHSFPNIVKWHIGIFQHLIFYAMIGNVFPVAFSFKNALYLQYCKFWNDTSIFNPLFSMNF